MKVVGTPRYVLFNVLNQPLIRTPQIDARSKREGSNRRCLLERRVSNRSQRKNARV